MAVDALTEHEIVPATVNYHPPVAEGGPAVTYAGRAGEKLREWDTQRVMVRDTQTCTQPPTLDKNGFQVVTHPTTVEDFTNHELIKTIYYRECEEALKKFASATRVIPFSHVHRNHSHTEAVEHAKTVKPTDLQALRAPASYCHVDESYVGATQCLRDNLPMGYDIDQLTKTRWGIINLWRPLKPVNRDHLATLDFATVDEATDLHQVKMVMPPPSTNAGALPKGTECEVFLVGSNPKHQWYYTSHMKPEELLFLKIFDSKNDGRAKCCPHTAVQTEIDEGPARESIETRFLVFWENEGAE